MCFSFTPVNHQSKRKPNKDPFPLKQWTDLSIWKRTLFLKLLRWICECIRYSGYECEISKKIYRKDIWYQLYSQLWNLNNRQAKKNIVAKKKVKIWSRQSNSSIASTSIKHKGIISNRAADILCLTLQHSSKSMIPHFCHYFHHHLVHVLTWCPWELEIMQDIDWLNIMDTESPWL